MSTDEFGKMNWTYLRDESSAPPASNFTKFQLQTNWNPPRFPKPTSPHEAAKNAMSFLVGIQDDSGIFPCQYGGPMFMVCGYVIAKYFTKVPFSPEERIEITRYIVNRAHPVDGGWGLHSFDKTTVFGTVMNYVVLRLLGMDASHPVAVKARRTLLALGGAIGSPMWGKVYLAVLNLYKWEGVNPSPPELWALPYAVPIHPGRWWVHTRAIYLPMGYLSMNKIQADVDPLIEALRTELFTQSYDKIDFGKHRNTVCSVDLYYPHSSLLTAMNAVLAKWEQWRPDWVRKRCNKMVLDLVLKDLQNTDWLAIAPVSNVMNAMVVYCELGKDSPEFQRFLYRWPDFLTMSPEGLQMNGTNGVQVWDVSFALQYAVVAGLADNKEFHNALIKGYRFLVRSQFTEDPVPGSYRDHRNGAWPFSTKIQGFTVSDCTAEALKAIIMIQHVEGLEFLSKEIDESRLYDAVDILLAMQNRGSFHFGSWSTYEKAKAPVYLEKLNPAEVFGNIMVEYPYVECTDSVVLGLSYFTKYFDYRKADIKESIKCAIDYIKEYQRPDGSWYGSWGVCFTYAGMFAVEALHTQGYNYGNSETVKRGCNFILRYQEADGGWAEDFRSCELFSYVRHTSSQPVQTAWAAIMLLLADYPNVEVIAAAIRFLMSKQNDDGSFSFNHVEGVFNHSCAIEYPNYKYYFTMKALGMFAEKYPNIKL